MRMFYNPPYLVKAWIELQDLKEYARKVKEPPKRRFDKENRPKQERPPFQEASKDFYFDCKPEDTQSQRVFQTPESEIIKFLSKTSSLSFSLKGIEDLSIQFGITEFRLRQLISSVINNKMRG